MFLNIGISSHVISVLKQHDNIHYYIKFCFIIQFQIESCYLSIITSLIRYPMFITDLDIDHYLNFTINNNTLKCIMVLQACFSTL